MSEEKKRFVVELSSKETLVSRALLVIEVPATCSVEDIKELDGDDLHDIATENGSEVAWDFEESEGDFSVLSGIDVGQRTVKSPDVELTFDDLGNLVATQCQ